LAKRARSRAVDCFWPDVMTRILSGAEATLKKRLSLQLLDPQTATGGFGHVLLAHSPAGEELVRVMGSWTGGRITSRLTNQARSKLLRHRICASTRARSSTIDRHLGHPARVCKGTTTEARHVSRRIFASLAGFGAIYFATFSAGAPSCGLKISPSIDCRRTGTSPRRARRKARFTHAAALQSVGDAQPGLGGAVEHGSHAAHGKTGSTSSRWAWTRSCSRVRSFDRSRATCGDAGG